MNKTPASSKDSCCLDTETLSTIPVPIKGRGATGNLAHRFTTWQRADVDDGWERESEADNSEPVKMRTQVTLTEAKSILSRNQSPDLPFSVSLNPYQGCEHGCIYCFARPTHSYLELSPGLDFETRIFAKMNAADLLRKTLSRSGYVPEPIALGVNTDAYQPCERELKITRQVLEVLHACRHPLALITKSSLIERDMDLLADMAKQQLVIAAITITTLDPRISRTLEPRAAAPERRLRTIRMLREAGIPVCVSIAPVIPFITEPDLEKIMEAAAEAGADSAGYIVLRLPHEVSPLFQDWLQAYFPERAQRVMNRIRDMRGGKDYVADFGQRMKGEGIWADLIRQRFEKAAIRFGLKNRGRHFKGLETTHFRRDVLSATCNTADNKDVAGVSSQLSFEFDMTQTSPF